MDDDKMGLSGWGAAMQAVAMAGVGMEGYTPTKPSVLSVVNEPPTLFFRDTDAKSEAALAAQAKMFDANYQLLSDTVGIPAIPRDRPETEQEAARRIDEEGRVLAIANFITAAEVHRDTTQADAAEINGRPLGKAGSWVKFLKGKSVAPYDLSVPDAELNVAEKAALEFKTELMHAEKLTEPNIRENYIRTAREKFEEDCGPTGFEQEAGGMHRNGYLARTNVVPVAINAQTTFNNFASTTNTTKGGGRGPAG